MYMYPQYCSTWSWQTFEQLNIGHNQLKLSTIHKKMHYTCISENLIEPF